MNAKQSCLMWPDCDCPIESDCKAFSFTASSGDSGPVRAPERQASPAARAIDPDEAVIKVRAAMAPVLKAGTPQPQSLKQRGEQILAEMRANLERSDDALWMIRRELGHRADLIDAVFSAHVDMGFVSRDLRELVKDL